MVQVVDEVMTPKSFYDRAVDITRRIPQGRVATYGQVAALAGNPRAARQVARVLHSSSEKENLPWHRVVNGRGGISLKRNQGYELQKELLRKERVVFKENDCIDLERFLWVPQM